MDWKLELVPVPVTDVDRAKTFYRDGVGFTVDHDVRASDEMRVVQLTPPGSACSIVLGTGIIDSQPGSIRSLHLVVADIDAARAELVGRGVEVTDVEALGSSRDGGHSVFSASFSDPDGNSWALQEIRVNR
jgi:predicted enzyme related to lactoylglutathione lyase